MNLTEKHPAELDFHKMIKEVKNLLEKCENQYLDGEDREVITRELKEIKQRLFDFQMERFTQFINDRGRVENLPAEEEKLQREMTDLQMIIGTFINPHQ